MVNMHDFENRKTYITREEFYTDRKEKEQAEVDVLGQIDERRDEIKKLISQLRMVQTKLHKFEERNDNFRESY